MDYIARENALALLKRYNQDPFHLQHAFTVEAVMKWYANELGYAEDAEFLDFLRSAARFLFLCQQYYEWRLDP